MVVGSFFRKAFTDSDGHISYGRLASAYCLVGALDAFICGFIFPQFQTYCTSFMNAMLLQSIGFYGVSKGQQAVSAFSANKKETVNAE